LLPDLILPLLTIRRLSSSDRHFLLSIGPPSPIPESFIFLVVACSNNLLNCEFWRRRFMATLIVSPAICPNYITSRVILPFFPLSYRLSPFLLRGIESHRVSRSIQKLAILSLQTHIFGPHFLIDRFKVLINDEIFFEFKNEFSPGIIKTNDAFYVL
jgi:hypothetical protein